MDSHDTSLTNSDALPRQDRGTALRILLVEDNEHDVLAFRRAFQRGKVSNEITRYVRAEKALERLEADAISVSYTHLRAHET